jgi:hypothetical protein
MTSPYLICRDELLHNFKQPTLRRKLHIRQVHNTVTVPNYQAYARTLIADLVATQCQVVLQMAQIIRLDDLARKRLRRLHVLEPHTLKVEGKRSMRYASR